MIAGSSSRSLVVHPDERGLLFEVLRCDDPEFKQFGQVYVTTAKPGIVKGWHMHKLQTDYFCLIEGRARFVLYDARANSPTFRQIDLINCDGAQPRLIIIPPFVYHGFKNTGDIDAVCMNCPTEPFDREHPDEYRLDPHTDQIPYDWHSPDSARGDVSK